jgi:predicted metal-dependent phosphoesterase TrpH
MRCDLHVHTLHSGPVDIALLRHLSRECYSQPRDAYAAARRRGMDLVTITDHDTIAGALQLAGEPDFFVSEEVTCQLPGGRELHLGVFDIDEAQHEQISRRRRDAESLFAYLAEQRLPACVNHLFSPLTGRREVEDFHLALRRLRLIEARNGMMPAGTNLAALQAGGAAGLSGVGGSDAHTLAAIGRAYTVVPEARDKETFLAGLRQGLTLPAGRSGSYARLTSDVFRVFGGAYAESAREALSGVAGAARFAALLGFLPLVGLIPVIALVNYLHEVVRGIELQQRFEGSLPSMISLLAAGRPS